MVDRLTASSFVATPDYLFVREAALASLRGAARTLLLTGQAGVGKSRIVQELTADFAGNGVRLGVGYGRQDLQLPYVAVLPALRAIVADPPARVRADRPHEWRIVDQFLTGSWDNAPTGSGVRDPQGADLARFTLLDSIARLVIQLAEGVPVLLAVEDLHWADEYSLDLVELLLSVLGDRRESAPLRLFVILTSRDEPQSPRIERLIGRLAYSTWFARRQISPLSPPAAAEFARLLLGSRAAPNLLDEIERSTGGNPLLIRELVRELESRQALSERNGYVVSTVSVTTPSRSLPFEGRLARTSPSARALLRAASVLGTDFTLTEVAALLDRPLPATQRALDECVAAGLVVWSDGAGRMAHPLLRDSVLRSTAPELVQEMHARAATALEPASGGTGPLDAPALARHLRLAGPFAQPARSARVASIAGDSLVGLTAWKDAAVEYDYALSAEDYTASLSPDEHADLLLRSAFAHYRNLALPQSHARYTRALDIARHAGATRVWAEAVIGLTRLALSHAGAPGARVDIDLEAALNELLGNPTEGDIGLRGRILTLLSQVHYAARRQRDAEVCAREALRYGATAGDHLVSMYAETALGNALLLALRPGAAARCFNRALRHADLVEDRWARGWPLMQRPQGLIGSGALHEADGAAREAREFSRATRNWAEESLALATLAWLALARGSLDEVSLLVEEALQAFRRSDYRWTPNVAFPALVSMHHLRGSREDARDALEQWVEETGGWTAASRYQRLWRAALWGDSSEDDDVHALVASLVARPADYNALASLSLGAELVARADLADLRKPLFERLCAVVEGSGTDDDSAPSVVFAFPMLTSVRRQLAEVASLLDDLGAAERLAVDALTAAELAGARVEAAGARACLARLYFQQGRRDEGADAARRTVAEATALGLLPLRQRMLNLLAESALPVEPPSQVAEVRPLPIRVLLAADICRSTGLNLELGDDAYGALLVEQLAGFRLLLDQFGGVLHSTAGDGFLSSFTDVRAAVNCGIELQRQTQRRRSLPPFPDLYLRIGINVGQPQPVGDDVTGVAVIVTTRIRDAGGPGDILVSAGTRELLEGSRVRTVPVEPLAPKGFAARNRGLGEQLALFRVDYRTQPDGASLD